MTCASAARVAEIKRDEWRIIVGKFEKISYKELFSSCFVVKTFFAFVSTS